MKKKVEKPLLGNLPSLWLRSRRSRLMLLLLPLLMSLWPVSVVNVVVVVSLWPVVVVVCVWCCGWGWTLNHRWRVSSRWAVVTEEEINHVTCWGWPQRTWVNFYFYSKSFEATLNKSHGGWFPLRSRLPALQRFNLNHNNLEHNTTARTTMGNSDINNGNNININCNRILNHNEGKFLRRGFSTFYFFMLYLSFLC